MEHPRLRAGVFSRRSPRNECGAGNPTVRERSGLRGETRTPNKRINSRAPAFLANCENADKPCWYWGFPFDAHQRNMPQDGSLLSQTRPRTPPNQPRAYRQQRRLLRVVARRRHAGDGAPLPRQWSGCGSPASDTQRGMLEAGHRIVSSGSRSSAVDGSIRSPSSRANPDGYC